jgi:hypothetical protein
MRSAKRSDTRTSDYARMRCLASFDTDEKLVHRWTFLCIESCPVISSSIFTTTVSRPSLDHGQLGVQFHHRLFPALWL